MVRVTFLHPQSQFSPRSIPLPKRRQSRPNVGHTGDGGERGRPKSKPQNAMVGFRVRDSRETLTECRLLFCKEIWLGVRDDFRKLAHLCHLSAPPLAGSTFEFRRKRFVGSYRVLS